MDGGGARSGACRVGGGESGKACPDVASHCGGIPSSSTSCARGGGGSDCSSGGGGGGVGKAMLGPTCRLGTPDGHLVVLIAVRELVRAAIVDVQALAHLCKVSRCKWALGDSGGERLAVVASRAALPFREPLAVEEGAMDEEVINVLLPRWARVKWLLPAYHAPYVK